MARLQSTAGNRRVQRAMTEGTGADHATRHPPIPHLDGDWRADPSPGRSDGALVLSGHGDWKPADGYIRVPAGTVVHFYTQHGQQVGDVPGGEVERGEEAGHNIEQGREHGAPHIFTGGRSIPNYQLSPPSGLTISGNPVIATRRQRRDAYQVRVDPEAPSQHTIAVESLRDARLAGHPITFSHETTLGEILQPNMGVVHFAACRFVKTKGRGRTRNQRDALTNP